MDITLYNNTDDPRVMNKAPAAVQSTEIVFLDAGNVVDVAVDVKMFAGYDTVNYMHIPELNRYYYVTGKTIVPGGIVRYTGHCDVLMSHQASILSSQGILSRSSKFGNVLVQDTQQLHRADEMLTNLAFSGCEFTQGVGAANFSFLLTVFGGVNTETETPAQTEQVVQTTEGATT